ncbi:uncharacterized, partial [Tachysurus ichikawai]
PPYGANRKTFGRSSVVSAVLAPVWHTFIPRVHILLAKSAWVPSQFSLICVRPPLPAQLPESLPFRSKILLCDGYIYPKLCD